MNDLGLSVECRCLRCGAERDIPARDDIVRTLGEAPTVYVQTKTKCLRCPSRTVRIRLLRSEDSDD